MDSEYFDDRIGEARNFKRRRLARLIDKAHNLPFLYRRRLDRIVDNAPPRRLLLVGIEVPSRPTEIHAVMERLSATKHSVTTAITPMGDRGKFENVNNALADVADPIDSFDWMLIVDDDIAFEPGFLDRLIAIAEHVGFTLCQPAHCFDSYASYEVTRRRFGTLARRTNFVEIGPVSAIHRTAFGTYLPFPASKWGWGIDYLWSWQAAQAGWRVGVVDGAPLRHLRPVGKSYDMAAAAREGTALIREAGVEFSRAEVMLPTATVASVWR